MTTSTDYTLLFESGEGDTYWTIEESPEGLLCITSNAETRRTIEPANYRGWDADEFRVSLEAEGMESDLIDRIFEQAGLEG